MQLHVASYVHRNDHTKQSRWTIVNFTVESDIGLKRKINEDRAAFFERPAHFNDGILADCLGGDYDRNA